MTYELGAQVGIKCVCTQWPRYSPSHLYTLTCFSGTPSLPLTCVRTLWMPPMQNVLSYVSTEREFTAMEPYPKENAPAQS